MNRRSALRGFTLVELIVAVGLLAIVLLLLASMTNSTASIWRLTSGKIEEFRSAGNAFDALTRRLSQATLNTYWDYDSPTAPTTYLRHSELRFLSGPATANSYGSGVFPSNVVTSGTTTTHAIFFQAPLGFVDESPLIDNPNFGGLDNLVNTWGYYVEYNADVRPNFINSLAHPPPARNRYRLMELMQPSNQMTIYNYTSGYNVSGTTPRSLTYVTNPPLAGLSLPTLPSGLTPTSTPGGGREWFTDALNAAHPPVHVLAENVIALILLPQLSPEDETPLIASGTSGAAGPLGTSLAPNYSYDSTATSTWPALNSQNQLPPVVQVTMVAIDEISAKRMSATDVANLDAELAGLFTNASTSNAGIYNTDLRQNTTNTNNLESYLIAHKMNYRIFTSAVAIRGAKWSRN